MKLVSPALESLKPKTHCEQVKFLPPKREAFHLRGGFCSGRFEYQKRLTSSETLDGLRPRLASENCQLSKHVNRSGRNRVSKIRGDQMRAETRHLSSMRLRYESSMAFGARRLSRRHSQFNSVLRERSLGFTLIELLVVIAIIALLASLLLPSLSRGLEQGRRAKCLSNNRQLTLGLLMYADDFGVYPLEITMQARPKASYGWDRSLAQYTQSVWTNALYHCPSYRGPTIGDEPVIVSSSGGRINISGGSDRRLGSYAYNALGTAAFGAGESLGLGGSKRWFDGETQTDRTIQRRATDVVVPSEMIAIGDAQHGSPQYFWVAYERLQTGAFSHGQRANISFCDGHVEGKRTFTLFAPSTVSRSRWNHDHDPHSL